MATNHTTNYNLNLWEASDKFVREEFNENTTKIDAAIKAEANARASAVSALEKRLKVVAGTYVGDGTNTRVVGLGFTPKAILVVNQTGIMYSNGQRHGGLTMQGYPANNGIEIVDGGIKVYHNGDNYQTNRSDTKYHYLAFV